MEILDFSVKQGRGRGLTFTMVPFNDGPVLSEAVHVDEIPFGLVEYCVGQIHEEYRNFGHWSNTKLSAREWILVAKEMRKIISIIESSSSAEDLAWLGRNFSTLSRYFSDDFLNAKSSSIALLHQIVLLVENWIIRFEWICIEGI